MGSKLLKIVNMKKRLLYLLLAIASSIPGWSQDKQFEEALKRGRGWGELYLFENTAGKAISLDKLNESAKKRNYIVFDYSIKNISRFGDMFQAIHLAEFIPEDEYPSYIYEHLVSEFSRTPFKELSHEGNVYGYYPTDALGRIFQLCKGVRWSGLLANNMIEGGGVGFAKTSDGYMLIHGSFKAGIPQGKFTTKYYPSHRSSFNPQSVKVLSVEVGDFSEGLAPFLSNGKWGFIEVNANANVVVQPTYASVEGFKGGKAKVRNEQKELWIDRTGKFIGYTDAQKKLDQEEAEKQRKQELEAQQRREREQREKEERQRYRRQRAKELEEGDVITYSYYSSGLFFSDTWSFRCNVERNKNGEKLQVRIDKITKNGYERDEGRLLGRSVRQGDLLWISSPASDERWSY